jgi:hypothetical protein
MNWGHGPNYQTTWYTLDELPGTILYSEAMLIDIVPQWHIGPLIIGVYLLQWNPPRYFDMDAIGSEATFMPGNLIQTFPGITIKGVGTNTDVAFYGTSGLTTEIFTGGYQPNGIHIHNGAIHLRNNGSIKLERAY